MLDIQIRSNTFRTTLQSIQACAFLLCMSFQVGAQDVSASAKDPTMQASNPALIEAFGAKYASITRAPQKQARIFIYRSRQVLRKEPVNIYLEGRYHTSLIGGGFSTFCAAPGNVATQTAPDDAQKLHMGKYGTAQKWAFQPEKILYLKVQETNAGASLTEVPAERAQRELSDTAQQIHTVSRAPIAQVCDELKELAAVKPEAPPPPPAVNVPRLYALEADALFEFGKTELRAASYNVIEIMAQRLKSDFSQVERIRVVGYTDPIGPDMLNKKLSLGRAQMVADQLKARGLNPVKGFVVEGLGPAQLVKTGCGKTPSPENKLCHAPNRRVEIVVTGAKR